jgi:hypothetical protein
MRFQLSLKLNALANGNPGGVLGDPVVTPPAELTPLIPISDGLLVDVLAVTFEPLVTIEGLTNAKFPQMVVTAGLSLDGGPYDRLLVVSEDLALTYPFNDQGDIGGSATFTGSTVLPSPLQIDWTDNFKLSLTVTPPAGGSAVQSTINAGVVARIYGTADTANT